MRPLCANSLPPTPRKADFQPIPPCSSTVTQMQPSEARSCPLHPKSASQPARAMGWTGSSSLSPSLSPRLVVTAYTCYVCIILEFSLLLLEKLYQDIIHIPYNSPIQNVHVSGLQWVQSRVTTAKISEHFHHLKRKPFIPSLAHTPAPGKRQFTPVSLHLRILNIPYKRDRMWTSVSGFPLVSCFLGPSR